MKPFSDQILFIDFWKDLRRNGSTLFHVRLWTVAVGILGI
jgi:hypothetical protein